MFLGMTLHTHRGMKGGLFHRKYIHEYALENMFVYFTKYIILLSYSLLFIFKILTGFTFSLSVRHFYHNHTI